MLAKCTVCGAHGPMTLMIGTGQCSVGCAERQHQLDYHSARPVFAAGLPLEAQVLLWAREAFRQLGGR